MDDGRTGEYEDAFWAGFPRFHRPSSGVRVQVECGAETFLSLLSYVHRSISDLREHVLTRDSTNVIRDGRSQVTSPLVLR